MASKKNLKQDINRIVNELVADCLQYMKMQPGKAETEIAEIISEALKMRKELIYKLNHLEDTEDAKKLKSQINEIAVTLIGKTDASYKTLSKLPR
ncbi:MAG: hypothetical protein KBB11_03425 [Bacteroidales bacterium]|nr:hypothetical protein [Bacteroidales bacterium]HOY39748.1 hypothetical protein [Bacteroidales bacterium]HQP04354.1 hypothetical protein [Bacteroidales bacterium]